MEPTPAPPDGSGTATGGDEQSNPVSVVAVLCGSVHCATESWDSIRFGSWSADDGLDTSLLSSSYSSSVASSPGGGQSKSLATTLSIVLSIVGAVVLTALFTLYYHRRRRRRQRQQRPVLELLDDDNAPYLPLDSAGITPPSTGPPSDGPPDRTRDVASHRTDSARPGQPDPDMPPPPLHRRTAGPRPPEMAQLPAPAPGSPHSLVVASMLARDAPPPLPRRPRPRATTLGDAPHDDLPPYVDPIEEALAGDTPLSPDSDDAALQPDIQSPPPYYTIATPDRAVFRH
ncbi:hypothetical protein H4R19_001196 [Coemansia spiralis]|nr:hypothetical protein H4R19_001196 [Coemansia spiralis]